MRSISFGFGLAARISLIFGLSLGGSVLPVWTMPVQALELSTASLTLHQALTLAQDNYGLSASQTQIEVQRALAEQARRGPNPNLNLSLEEFPSLNQKSGELSLTWQQTWAVSGRLTRQGQLAEQETQLAELALNLQQAILRRDLTQAFYRVLTWQTYLDELENLLANAQNSRALVTAQHQLGKVLLTEVNRAGLLEADLRLQIQKSTLQWEQAKADLALFWNQSGDTVPPLVGTLMTPIEDANHGPEERDRISLKAHPEWLQADQRIVKQELNLNLQQALAWPDLTGSLGVRYLPYQDNLGSLASLSWPLPIANANQGNQTAAEQQIKQAQLNQRTTQIQLENLMRQSQLAYQNTQALIKRYQEQVLPMAEQNLDLNQIAYDAGKLPYLAVLDTQRSLMNFKLDYIKAWGEYWRVKTQLDYFTQAN